MCGCSGCGSSCGYSEFRGSYGCGGSISSGCGTYANYRSTYFGCGSSGCGGSWGCG